MASRYTKEQVHAALILYRKLQSLPKVVETLGYPSRGALACWVHQHPEVVAPKSHKRPIKAPIDVKLDAIRRCYENGETLKSVAEEIGYSSVAILTWHKKYLEKGLVGLMNKSDTESSRSPESIQNAKDIEALKAQMMDMQMEIDILRETLNVIKKDPGVNQAALKNCEKTVIIDALKNSYSLSKLCKRMNISRSSYYYQESLIHAEDKYDQLRDRITELFHKNYDAYGYRKIHMLLKRDGITVSEKVIRRLMKQCDLVVKRTHRRKYNSYKGEISPAVPNLLKRNFHSDKPNEKWITDITEFSIKAGKVYLSPVIDCLDGMPVSWTIGTSPNAELANDMIKEAISTLKPNEKPIIHSDRGCHYRWPEWIQIVTDAGLTRSMSKKGCSPDNSACEGFFGHLKNEMFYGYNWDDYSISEFIKELNDYINWYCTSRIKSTLGGFSPLEYRRRIGVGV